MNAFVKDAHIHVLPFSFCIFEIMGHSRKQTQHVFTCSAYEARHKLYFAGMKSLVRSLGYLRGVILGYLRGQIFNLDFSAIRSSIL
jgi:hypothetical protein